MQEKKLKQYCEMMLLQFEIEDGIFSVNDKDYLIIPGDMNLFDEDFEFIPDTLSVLEEKTDGDGFVYEFCGRWYLQDRGEDISFEELKYIGKAKQKLPIESFLGIHSGFELMNGIGLYKDWVKKAKFLGIKSLAIVERATLAGALEFQSTCKDNDIKSIIGLSIPVQGSEKFDVKLYAKDFQGWLNLLKFNAAINIDKDLSVSMEFLQSHGQGLFLVADPKTTPFEDALKFADYYQLDTVRFLNEEKDVEFTNNFEKYLISEIDPIKITDAYYLEQEDFLARESLWAIGKSFDDKTDNQYFKNNDQYAKELILLFEKGNESWIYLYKEAIANEKHLVENCNFSYDTDTRHLPKYIMTDFEKIRFSSNEQLFLHLIKKGFRDRKIVDTDKYIARLKTEIEVLQQGDVIDYFLSLYDIIRYARGEGMLTGIGRGSAGGSLVAYLLDIIQIDPLEFDLLFERFLNSGRMGEYQDRALYEVETDDGKLIQLAEGALVRVKRGDRETAVFIHDLQEGDEIVRY